MKMKLNIQLKNRFYQTILWLLINVLIFYPHQIQQLTGQGKKITAPQKKYFIWVSMYLAQTH